ncbi:formin-like protein 13 isoform X2 [Silene latifolia]|uniref:formin-like protein 13 isoform X2 n=1 Tax=Silene latifolia TaxID=37657 RepID=UPI003D77C14C
MALLRKLFYRKPPDGLLEISERVYVFDSCFSMESLEKKNYKGYIEGVANQLREQFPDAALLVFNFRQLEAENHMSKIMYENDMTIMDYPRHYEGCPILSFELIYHFLRSTESWLAVGPHNILLMHCEHGGWPVLAFMLAAFLIYSKQYTGELRTLNMVYKQAPPELLSMLSLLNPFPSQLRYLQYVSRRNVSSHWPPLDRPLTLDCIIIRLIPHFNPEEGCRPVFRIYARDPLSGDDRTPKLLFSTRTKTKAVRLYKQVESELVKIDINCNVQGDVVLECSSLRSEMDHEDIMFRIMFNTAFIRSNILILNRDEIDTPWNTKDHFSNDFRAEVLFSDMESNASVTAANLSCFEEKQGLPMEAFAKVQEFFSHVEWLDSRADAALSVIQKISASCSSSESVDRPACTEILQASNLQKLKEELNSNMGGSSEAVHNQSTLSAKLLEKLNLGEKEEKLNKFLGEHLPEAISQKRAKASPVSMLSTSSTATRPHEENSSVSDFVLEVLRNHLDASSEKVTSSGTQTSSLQLHAKLPPAVSNVESNHVTFPSSSPAPTISENLVHACKDSGLTSDSDSNLAKVGSSAPTSPPVHHHIDDIGKFEPPSPPPPPPAPLSSLKLSHENVKSCPAPQQLASLRSNPVPPPPPPPPGSVLKPQTSSIPSAPPLPIGSGNNTPASLRSTPVPPPPPPSGSVHKPQTSSLPSAPSPPIGSGNNTPASLRSTPLPPPPPPPGSLHKPQTSSLPSAPPPPIGSGNGAPKAVTAVPGPPPPLSSHNARWQNLSRGLGSKDAQNKKLKPLHWLKLTRAVQGSLWAESQKLGESSNAPEIDMTELENLFSASVPNSDQGSCSGKLRVGVAGSKPDKVQLVDHRRACNCEIMLSKVKVPLHELMVSVLSLENSALDADQVDNLIKFCPTKEEMELLKGYRGEVDKLGKCEQFFLELMRVPRVEAKLRVFSFKMQFETQVSDLRKSLNTVGSASDQIRNSVKLKRVMQTVLSLGNALNQGTARGSAVGFRLDSLLKLTETRARNNKMTLMHYLCKIIAEKLPEVLDFSEDLTSLEPATKIQLKYLAEEMQAVNKGLEKILQELSMSENDGPVSEEFHKKLKEFLCFAEAEVRSLALLYSSVGRNVDALIIYFGEDPSRCPFEQVVATLLNFTTMFSRAHEENLKQLVVEKKKEKDLENQRLAT